MGVYGIAAAVVWMRQTTNEFGATTTPSELARSSDHGLAVVLARLDQVGQLRLAPQQKVA